MAKFQVGDRVYCFRKNDPIAQEGYGRIQWIDGTRARLLWEHNGKEGGVESRDLFTEDEAINEGLTQCSPP